MYKAVTVSRPGNRHQSEDARTLDDIETSLQQALSEADSPDTRYYIRETLQKIDSLRWQQAGDGVSE